MRIQKTSIAFAVALVGAAGFALAHANQDAPVASAPTTASPASAVLPADLENTEPAEMETALPPNHPPIDHAGGASPHGGGASPHGGALAAPSDEPAALSWKTDASWKSLPNPSAMRLATYGVPRAAGDTADAELSISRAGGDTDANIARWAGQFEGGPKPVRKDTTTHGLKVAVVELEGTYSGGMGAAGGSHDGWAMLGAIVETPGQPYFFKLTGPKATVHAARAKFDAMITSATPAK